MGIDLHNVLETRMGDWHEVAIFSFERDPRLFRHLGSRGKYTVVHWGVPDNPCPRVQHMLDSGLFQKGEEGCYFGLNWLGRGDLCGLLSFAMNPESERILRALIACMAELPSSRWVYWFDG